jgi:RNA polymerase sigma-70 factor (ECF subfamily)
MSDRNADTEALVTQAAAGDARARDQLFSRHSERLRRMISVRMDRRLSARIDPSDVVQDTFAEVARQLDGYLQQRALPFYPWLRHVAWQRLMQLHRKHLEVQKRSVVREQEWDHQRLPDESALELAEKLVASQASPSQHAIRNETLQQVMSAMGQLGNEDREILVLRHLEQLSVKETAAVLGLTPGNVKVRHFRAVQQLQHVLQDTDR